MQTQLKDKKYIYKLKLAQKIVTNILLGFDN